MRKKFKPPHTNQSKDISHMSVCASLITRYRVMTNEFCHSHSLLKLRLAPTAVNIQDLRAFVG